MLTDTGRLYFDPVLFSVRELRVTNPRLKRGAIGIDREHLLMCSLQALHHHGTYPLQKLVA
jgi:hypothetical protein